MSQPFFCPLMKILALVSLLFFLGKDPTAEVNKLVDDWHLAATNADFNGYFDKMHESSVFIGTAPGERWTKVEFILFAKPFFDKGKAWDFKASNRQWGFSDDGKTAWFDEELDTWMLGCRGSGVLKKVKGGWKIMFYDLHVLIENEKTQAFIELRRGK